MQKQPPPPAWVDQLKKAAAPRTTVDVARIDADASLLPYQLEAVKFAKSRGGRILLTDEMGLGKTAQALTLMRQYPKDWPLLVLAPKAVLTQWELETRRWIAPTLVIQIAREGKKTVTRQKVKQTIETTWNSNSDVCICTYDIFKNNKELRKCPKGGTWRCVILDESHKCKNPDAERTKAIMPVVERADRVALLTGTPMSNGANDIWPQLKMVIPRAARQHLPNFWGWRQRYCECVQIHTPSGYVNTWRDVKPEYSAELHDLLYAVQMRRYKKDVLKQLPKKRRHKLYLEAKPGIMGKANKLMQQFKALPKQGDDVLAADQEPTHKVMELFTDTAVLGVEPCVEWIKETFFEEKKDDRKILVFAHHQKVLDKLEATLKANLNKGDTMIRIDGKVPGAQRDARVARFKTDKACRVALLSLGTCSTGLTLTEASNVLFAEMIWSPKEMEQAEDRVHRLSQTKACDVYYSMLPGTLDECIFSRLQSKSAMIRAVVDGPGAPKPPPARPMQGLVTPTKPPAAARVKPAAPVTPPVVVDLTEDFEDAADDEPIALTQDAAAPPAAPALPVVTPAETKKRPREPDSDDDSVLGYDSGFGKKARG